MLSKALLHLFCTSSLLFVSDVCKYADFASNLMQFSACDDPGSLLILSQQTCLRSLLVADFEASASVMTAVVSLAPILMFKGLPTANSLVDVSRAGLA